MGQGEEDSLIRQPEFAPAADANDGRPLGDWVSRWPPEARRRIRVEAAYVVLLFVTDAVLLFLVWNNTLNSFLGVRPAQEHSFHTYANAALGGLLGGVLFDLKWLYHAVARGKWHSDRRLWRLFTPLISAGLAFATIALGVAEILPLIDVRQLTRPPATVGTAFLIGYFSDKVVAAMSGLTDKVLGASTPNDESSPAKTAETPEAGGPAA